jgi:hypothetical protein
MKTRHVFIALALTAACGQSLAASPIASRQGNLPSFGEPSFAENRIVGLWQAALTLAPCSGGPATSINALNTFHAGGTLSSTDNAPQPSNGPAQGSWESRGHGHYLLHVQFFTFLPGGTTSGLADVHQELTLDPAGSAYTSVLEAHVLDPNGNPVVELCGNAQGKRVALDPVH